EYLENSSNAITLDLPTEEPDNSLRIDMHYHLKRIVSQLGFPWSIKGSLRQSLRLLEALEHVCVCGWIGIYPALSVYEMKREGKMRMKDYFEDINYVEASPPNSELVSLEKVKDDILHDKLFNINLLIAKIESLNDNPTPDCVLKSPSLFPIPVEDSDSFFEKSDTSLSYSDNSLPEFDTFSDHTKETISGSTTTHADILGETHVHVPNVLPTHPNLMLDSDFIPSDDSLESDLEVSFPFGTRNKIFDLRIFFEVQSKRFLSRDTFSISFIRNILCPVIETLLPFSSENKEKFSIL
nr:hypothetical protein [Tanacetum cinerariifolium]